MYFAPNDAKLDLVLYCIRACAVVETPYERQQLILAWRKCLQNGPALLERSRILSLRKAMELA